jgi:hypothetical protein
MTARRDRHDFTLVSQGNWWAPPPGYCVGCGYHPVVHRRHREDCTAEPQGGDHVTTT